MSNTVGRTVGIAFAIALYSGSSLGGALEAPAGGSGIPYVVEITSVSRDSIPVRPPHDRLDKPPLFTVDKKSVRFAPSLMRQLRRREESWSLAFDASVEELADADVIVVERHRFAGNMRRYELERVGFYRTLPAFPTTPDAPGKVLLTPVGSEPNIFQMILWPENAWSLEPADNDEPARLLLDNNVALERGESRDLMERHAEFDVVLARFRPEKAGSEGGRLEVEQSGLGVAELTTTVTVTFHGRLPVEFAQ